MSTDTAAVRAWHNDPGLKAATVSRMHGHAARDRLIRGVYLHAEPEESRWQGCLHGCLVAEDIAAENGLGVDHLDGDGIDWHLETEARYGLARSFGRALDHIYERLTELPTGDVAARLLESIPVGADLEGVGGQLLRTLDQLEYAGPPSDQTILDEVCAILADAPIPQEVTA